MYARSLLLVCTIAAASAACSESSSAVSSSPTVVKCQLELAVSSQMAATGGTGSISVTTQPECAWTAATQASWISGITPASGQGSGRVEFRAEPNPLPAVREADITFNQDSVRVSQDAMPCRFAINPTRYSASASGGESTVRISARDECSWTARSDAAWITIVPPASGSGGGSIVFRVAANTGPSRTGTLTIAGQSFTVAQASSSSGPGPAPSPSCNYSINPSQSSAPASGGSGSISVSAGSGCQWTATSSDSWLDITSGSRGTGNGSVVYRVNANSGGARSGSISIADETFTVRQAASSGGGGGGGNGGGGRGGGGRGGGGRGGGGGGGDDDDDEE